MQPYDPPPFALFIFFSPLHFFLTTDAADRSQLVHISHTRITPATLMSELLISIHTTFISRVFVKRRACRGIAGLNELALLNIRSIYPCYSNVSLRGICARQKSRSVSKIARLVGPPNLKVCSFITCSLL